MLNVKREELKFYFPSENKDFIKSLLNTVMSPDPYNIGEDGYEISSLYFDSIDDRDFNQKLDGIMFREKYRLRIYNKDPSFGKFEIKRKLNNIIDKISVSLSYGDIKSILIGDFSSIEKHESVEYSAKLMNIFQYSPKTIVTYNRYAFFLPYDNIRITIDSNLSSHGFNNDILNLNNIEKNHIGKNGYSILEVKFEDELPYFIKDILNGMPFTRSAVSKYALSRIDNSTELQTDDPVIPF